MKPTGLFDRKGLTLVEAIVAGALSILVILTATTLFLMNSKQISGSLVSSLTKMQYQTIIDQIGSIARNASLISTTTAAFVDTDTLPNSSDTVFFLDTLGNVITMGNNWGGYTRSGNSFLEWNGSAFVNFKVGNKNIQVDDTTLFQIAADRKSVQLNLTVIGVDGSTQDTMKSKGETFVCRN